MKEKIYVLDTNIILQNFQNLNRISDNKSNKIVIHSTINRTQKPTEFIEEVDDFLDEWEAGLKADF